MTPKAATIAWFTTVLSFGYAVYVSIAAEQFRNVTAAFSQQRTAIVKGGTSRLSVSFAGKPVVGDISAAHVTIWNQGSLAVRKEHVLSPIFVRMANGEAILEATIAVSTRPHVTQWAINDSDAQHGKFGVSWNILERGDGATVQVIYAGKADAPIYIDGDIEGQGSVSTSRRASSYVAAGLWAVFCIGVAFLLFRKALSMEPITRALPWVISATVLFSLFLPVGVAFFWERDRSPPTQLTRSVASAARDAPNQ